MAWREWIIWLGLAAAVAGIRLLASRNRMSETQRLARETLGGLLGLLKQHFPVAEVGDFPKLDIGPGCRPSTLALPKIKQLYADAESYAAKRESEGAPTEFREFSMAFANSIVCREIDSSIGEDFRPTWREYLDGYWVRIAKSGYSMLRPQCETLAEGLVRAAQSTEVSERRKCVAIPIVPVGNCLAAAVLRRLYTELGWHVICPLWNLPRNDSRRNKAIAEGLAEIGKESGIVLHYLDEWVSGRNFLSVVGSISKTKWPSEQLVVTAICNQECGGPKDDSKLMTEIQSAGCGKPSAISLVRLPKCAFSPMDRDGQGLFTQDFGRLVAWRKISALQWLTLFVAGSKKALSDPAAARKKIAAIRGTEAIEQNFDKELDRERELLADHEPEFWNLIETSYAAAFPGSPYVIQGNDEPMAQGINMQEMIFVEQGLKKTLPLATVLVAADQWQDWDLGRNVYFLPPLRPNSRLPYHLLRLTEPESGIAEAFEEEVSLAALRLLRKSKAG